VGKEGHQKEFAVLSEIAEFERNPSHAVPDDTGQAGLNNDELLAVLGHELRTPVAAIRNAFQVLHRCGSDPATRDWVVGVLDRQTGQISWLIEKVLEFSRHGHVPLQTQSVDLVQTVGWAIETVRPSIDERGHVLEVVLPSGPVTLEADPMRLQQLLVNLLENAAKYTEPGGRIWLTVELAGDGVLVRVRDTGIGIVQEALPHVFDLFWRSSAAVGHSGLGIGLALVRRIAEMHGGSIQANSAGRGHGSEFVVALPLTRSLEPERGTAAPPPPETE
jgi:signal transduction histidine kinase